MAKIPKQAKRVFQGIIFDVYQWPQQLFDGSTATFEMVKRPDTAIVASVTPEGRVVVVDDEQPRQPVVQRLPGGRVDAGETPLAAAKRELLEETGYSSAHWELWYSCSPSSKTDSTIYYYVARDIRKTAEPHLDGGEKITVRLVSIDHLLDGIISGEHNAYALGAQIMRQLLQGKRHELTEFILYKPEKNL